MADDYPELDMLTYLYPKIDFIPHEVVTETGYVKTLFNLKYTYETNKAPARQPVLLVNGASSNMLNYLYPGLFGDSTNQDLMTLM